MSLQIQPGKFLTEGGEYVEILSQKTMQQGAVKFWSGRVLSHLTHRGGMQNAWDENGEDMGGNSELRLVAPAWIDAGNTVQ